MGALKSFAVDRRTARTAGEHAFGLPGVRQRAEAYRNTKNNLRAAAARYHDPVAAFAELMREATTAYQEKRAQAE